MGSSSIGVVPLVSIGLIVSLPNCNVSCWFLFGPLGVRASVVGSLFVKAFELWNILV